MKGEPELADLPQVTSALQFPTLAVSAVNETLRFRSVGGFQQLWIPPKLLADAVGDIAQVVGFG